MTTLAGAGHWVAGADEAGCGPLAGPVAAAAVILGEPIAGLDDSKRLRPARRETLAAEIRRKAAAWAVAYAAVWEVDRYNVRVAALLAMRRACLALPRRPRRVLVDGNLAPELPFDVETVVGGDGTVDAIAAASILAKVARDREMAALGALYPLYGFDRHMGYGTAEHLNALRAQGPCVIHRLSFAPVRLAAMDTGTAGKSRTPFGI